MADNWTLIQQQFNAVRSYASESFSLAEGYIADLSSYVLSTISTTPPTIDIPSTESVTIDTGLSNEMPTAPADTDYPTAPSTPADSGEHAFPTSPAYTLPTAPTLTNITIPTFIDGTISSLTATLPTMDFSVPTVSDIQSGGEATLSTLFQAARAKLEANILSGGTMIDATVEDDIWERDKERNEQALRDALDKATDQWAKLGFSLPDGLLAAQLAIIQNEYTNRLLDRSRDIAIKQAELEQAGMFKSLELAIGLEKVAMDSFNAYAARVMEASKATADVTIEIFKQRVVRYNVMLEAFKADVVSYKTSIEAEMARADVYKSKIAALELTTKVDDNRVRIYAAHLDAIGKMVDIYKTEVQAVALAYEAEKQKIERYKTQVEAYVAGVDAVNKKYVAQIEGFRAYVEAYKASAQSQTAILDVSTRAKIAEVEATIKEWEIQLKLAQETNTLRLEALRTVATTASNLAAGALAAGHASASASFGESVSTATSHSYSY